METKLFMYVVLFGIVASERLDGHTANDILNRRKNDEASVGPMAKRDEANATTNAQNEVERKVESPGHRSPSNRKPECDSDESESGSSESGSGSSESGSGSGESRSGSHQITRNGESNYGSGTSAVSIGGKSATTESIPTESDILIETAEPQMRTAKPQREGTREAKQLNTRDSSNDAASTKTKTRTKTTIDRDVTTSVVHTTKIADTISRERTIKRSRNRVLVGISTQDLDNVVLETTAVNTGKATSVETTPKGETEYVRHTRKDPKESTFESREIDVEIVYDTGNSYDRRKALNEDGKKPSADKSRRSNLTFKQTLIMGIAFALGPSVALILVIVYFLHRRAKVSAIPV